MEVTLRNWILPQKEKFSKGDLFEGISITFQKSLSALFTHYCKGDQEGEGVRKYKKRDWTILRKFKVYSDILSYSYNAWNTLNSGAQSYTSICTTCKEELWRLEMKKNQELKQTYISNVNEKSSQELYFLKLKIQFLLLFIYYF